MERHQFIDDLYTEHLEEASALYEQWLALRYDTELAWPELAAWETRWAAHIDALTIGGEPALAICARQAVEGDAGELFAAVSTMARHDRYDLLEAALDNLDSDDEDVVHALSDSLAFEAPDSWLADLAARAETDQGLAPAMIRLLGWRRSRAGDGLLAKRQSDPACHAALAWAYGRLGDRAAAAWLESVCLEQDQPALKQVAAVALLRLGDRRIVDRLRQEAAHCAWPLAPLGLCGEADDAQRLIQADRAAGLPGADGLLALGLLGEPAAAPLLINYLHTPQAADRAAMALNLITGAELYEQAFIPEEVDEDELLEEELEPARRGEPPAKADGSAPGETVRRPCRDADRWKAWLDGQGERFQPGRTYRYGQPLDAPAVLRGLTAESSPNLVREWAAHQLVCRFQIEEPFELDMSVPRQRQALARMSAALDAPERRNASG